MTIEFVAGRAGCGKSRYVMDKIGALLSDPLRKIIVIVPEQYTFQMERDIMVSCGVAGILGLSVLSFRRLVYRILEEAGGRAAPVVGAAAKCMTVRLALQREELPSFKKSARAAGFDAQMAELLTDLKRYDVTAGSLEEKAGQLALPYLRDKLLDVTKVYRRYEEIMAGRCDIEDIVNIAIENADKAPFLQGAHLIVDGFDMLTRQMKRLLKKLMELCASSLMTFRLPEQGEADAELFEPEARHFEEFFKYASTLTGGHPF